MNNTPDDCDEAANLDDYLILSVLTPGDELPFP